MAQTENARREPGASQCLAACEAQNTPTDRAAQHAGRAIAAGLVCLPDARDLAGILRRRLDRPKRIWLAASSLMSLPPDAAETLAIATLTDLEAWRLTPHEREVTRQRAAWRAHCSDPMRRARR